jgi:hypothetical protein
MNIDEHSCMHSAMHAAAPRIAWFNLGISCGMFLLNTGTCIQCQGRRLGSINVKTLVKRACPYG